MASANTLWNAEEITRRWRSLAERRRAHFVDLYDSGRWRRYYSEDAFRPLMRQVVKGAKDWSAMAAALEHPAARGPTPD